MLIFRNSNISIYQKVKYILWSYIQTADCLLVPLQSLYHIKVNVRKYISNFGAYIYIYITMMQYILLYKQQYSIEML